MGHGERARPYTPALGLTGGGGFDVVIDVLKRTANLDDPTSYVEAIKATDLQTHIGPDQVRRPVRQLRSHPARGRPVDRQGRRLGTVVVDNSHYPAIRKTADIVDRTTIPPAAA